MTSPQQPKRILGLAGKELIIIGLVMVFVCAGIGATALVVSRLASTVITALNQPTAMPELARQPPTATPIPTATPLPTFTSTPTPTAMP